MTENGVPYNFDYYERGIASGTSCYENYRWIPELTIPMAMTIIDYLEIQRNQTILDFGCAKGFLVKALRMLYRQAWGVDVSRYAIDNVDPMAKPYCFVTEPNFSLAFTNNGNKMPVHFDFCISKDVFEHIPEDTLMFILKRIPAAVIFVVVPLGDGKKYNIPVFHLDKTHIHRQPLDWWQELLDNCGWSIDDASYRVRGIKDNWANHQRGHGFIVARNKGLGYM